MIEKSRQCGVEPGASEVRTLKIIMVEGGLEKKGKICPRKKRERY
jgi:hypothetical protein